MSKCSTILEERSYATFREGYEGMVMPNWKRHVAINRNFADSGWMDGQNIEFSLDVI